MKCLLPILLSLSFFYNSLSAVEYGYFYGSSTQPSNQVEVPAGSYLRFLNDGISSDWIPSDDSYLILEINGSVFRERFGGGSNRYNNRKFIGPCKISYEFDSSSLGYLPYEISSEANALSPQIAVPAGQSLFGANDFLIQYSEDGGSWTNVSHGQINQSTYPKFFRLVLENPNAAIQETNVNFGFGSANPYTTSHFYKIINHPNIDHSAIGGWANVPLVFFLHLSEGEVLKFTNSGMTDQEYYFHQTNEHFNQLVIGSYSSGSQSMDEMIAIGPTTLYTKANNAQVDGTDDCISYTITTRLEQAQLSGAVLTVPSGAGTYTLKIQVSDDLNNDWIDLGGTAPETLSENMRFYRLVAVQN